MTQDFNYEEELSKCKTMQDITGQDGLVQKIIKDAVEHVLGMEMEDFILQEKEKDFPHVISIRKQISLQWGIMIPLIRIMDNLNLSEMEYEIKIHGIGVGGIKNILIQKKL